MNGISSRNVVVRNYVHMQQTRKKAKQWQVIITNALSFPAYPPGSDGNNETCLKMITHRDDKKTLKPHLTSDFIGPLPSPFTIQQTTWKTAQKEKSQLYFWSNRETWAEWFDIHQPVKWNWRKWVIRRPLLLHTKISCGSSLEWGVEGKVRLLRKHFWPQTAFFLSGECSLVWLHHCSAWNHTGGHQAETPRFPLP